MKNKGCLEQILCIRLLVDIARKSKKTLYVAFIDYSKAYDKVNRQKLLQLLDIRGCGSKFLRAIATSLSGTQGTIGVHKFHQSIGVRQGSCLSCPLFTFYIDETVRAMRPIPNDDWLGDLHILLLMDDTAIFATSRRSLSDKLKRIKDSADQIGMTLHPSKSRYLSVNANNHDPFIVDDVVIEHCEEYIYLGTPINNESIADQVKRHIKWKNSHLLKFSSFLTKNYDVPFSVKNKVRQCALNTALFYSCETWLCHDLKAADSTYLTSLKQMLGVRTTTCNDLVCIETDVPSAKSFIKDKQVCFLRKLFQREDFNTSIVCKLIDLARAVKSPAGLYLRDLQLNVNYSSIWMQTTRNQILTGLSSRLVTYRTLNPSLVPGRAYSDPAVPEYTRIAYSRIRLSSHRLRIETGRWSRTPRENRLCTCNQGVQNEEHILLHCPVSQHSRSSYAASLSCTSLSDLFDCAQDMKALCLFCHRTLSLY